MSTDNEKKFVPGDLVEHLSGGPKMTVDAISDDEKLLNVLRKQDDVPCKWFNGKKLESGWFSPQTLKKVTESGPVK